VGEAFGVNEYKIKTLADFNRIPADRLGACLRDFEYAINLRALALGAAAADTPVEEMTWRDDGNHSCDLTSLDGTPLLSLVVEDAQ